MAGLGLGDSMAGLGLGGSMAGLALGDMARLGLDRLAGLDGDARLLLYSMVDEVSGQQVDIILCVDRQGLATQTHTGSSMRLTDLTEYENMIMYKLQS